MKHDIDEDLQGWANRRRLESAPSREQTDFMLQRVHQALDEPPGQTPTPFRQKLWYAAMGMAAAVLLMLGARLLLVSDSKEQLSLALSAEELKAKAVVFQEVSQMFPNQLSWIGTSNGEIHMGLDQEQREYSVASEPLVRISYVLLHRQGDQWERIWDTEILTRAHASVELKPDPATHDALVVWVHPVEKKLWNVETNLQLAGPVSLQEEWSAIYQEGASSEVWSAEQDGNAYRMLQSIEVLRDV